MSYVKYLRIDDPAVGVRRVLLDRPERRNAVNLGMVEELHEAVAGAGPALLLGTSHESAFCAGGDLSVDPGELAEVSSRLYDLYLLMIRLPIVVVSCVQGTAIGAGAQLLLASDLRVGGRRTSISFAGAGTGLALGTWGLPALVGTGRAMDLSLSGRVVDADEALRIGLLDRVAEDPLDEALALCTVVAAAPPDVAARVKRLVRRASSDLEARLVAEREANAGVVHVAAGSKAKEP
jgi:enoyl-CoA hydratase/carnithine racemase